MDVQGWILVLASFIAVCSAIQLWIAYQAKRKIDWWHSVASSAVDEALAKVSTGKNLTERLHEAAIRVFDAGRKALRD